MCTNMTQLFGRLKFNDLLRVPRRCKNGPDHWSTKKRKIAAKDKALQHFDDFYQTVYGEAWENIRLALLKKKNKHMAIINNFGDTESTIANLESLGAINVAAIYEAQKKNFPFLKEIAETERKLNEKAINSNRLMEHVRDDKQKAELKSFYPEDYEPPQSSLDEAVENEYEPKLDEPLKPIKMRPIEEDLASAKYDESRIIKASIGLSTSALHEYVPATKIKGMDDWILESDHYSHYSRAADFSVNIDKEDVLRFPEHLKIYTFEARNITRFPQPRPSTTGLYDFYLMDGGSILPVLALDLQPGDAVLDMCAAPGGKTFAALQTLMPRILVANDIKLGRVHHLNNVIEEYFGDLNIWENRLYVTNTDARAIDEKDMYNKILVDVPCTTDRHVLHDDDNNMFKTTRLRERLQLPELQTEILTHALKLVAPGGTVVYSTCSLSPIQNDGVVQMALKKTWEENRSEMVVIDMIDALDPLRCLYKFGNFGLKYGHIVIPTIGNNWGPLYFCKIIRVR